MAYQLHRPDLDEGMLMMFRRPDSPYEQAVFHLKGLCENDAAMYLLEDADTETIEEYSAGNLRTALRVTIDQPRQSRLLFYKRK